MMSPGGSPITFSLDDISGFASWSADRNPLHVDPQFARQTHFGEQVVHGVLTVLRSLRAAPAAAPIRTLDIEFRAAVLVGETYEPQARETDDGLAVSLTSGGALVLDVRAGFVPA